MSKIDNDMFVDDFDFSLDDYISLSDEDVLEEDNIITDFVDYFIDKPNKDCYKQFNKIYEEYKKLLEILKPTLDEREKIVVLGEEMAILIAYKFDFNDEKIKDRKKAYIEFARDLLIEGSKKPYYRELSLLLYIKALYGQTNIAFSLEGKNRESNIKLGHEYVTRLERYTKSHALKGYVLSLRAYRYIMDFDLLEMSSEDRLKLIEKELTYASKWDDLNYFAEYALGLVYLNKDFAGYDVEKAKAQFEIVVNLENKETNLDQYVESGEKERIIGLAKKKLEALK